MLSYQNIHDLELLAILAIGMKFMKLELIIAFRLVKSYRKVDQSVRCGHGSAGNLLSR